MTNYEHQPGYAQYGPPPGPIPPPPRKRKSPVWLLAVAVAVVGLCCIGGLITVAAAAVGGDPEAAPATATTPAEETSEPAEEETEEPEETPELSDDLMEVVFLETLRDYGPPFTSVSDEELLVMGQLVCDEIAEEGFDARMVRLALDPDVDQGAAGFMTGVSVHAFCPEYTDDMDQFSETWG